MQVIGFGASSMAGVGDTKGGFFQRLQNANTERPDLTFVNLGVSGNTTGDMLARADAVRGSDHRLIVLLGCNDVPRANDTAPHRRATLEQYKHNLRALLPRIQGKSSLFISSFPVCAARTGVSEETLAAYMATARAVATECGFAVWDLYEELRGQDLTLYWASDGLHFNDAGHALIAARLSEVAPL